MGLSHSPQIVTDGLVLCLDAANPKSYPNYNLATYSQDFENAVYTKSTGLVTATGLLAPDDSLTATTLTDDSTTQYENFSRSFTVTNDSASYNISIYIKKTTGGTSSRTGFNVSFTGGTAKSYTIRFNTDTGVATSGDSNLVTTENNNYWRLSFTVSNNGTSNTTLNLSYYPATGVYNGSDDPTATGSHTVWGLQVTRGAALLPYNGITAQSANSLFDLSGFGNNATLVGGTSFNSSNRGSISFDFVNGVANINDADSLSFTNNIFTIDVWAYFNSVNVTQGVIGKRGWEYSIHTTGSNALYFYAWTAAGSGIYFNQTTIQAATWYNFSWVATGAQSILYVNSVPGSPYGKVSGTMSNTGVGLTVGRGGEASTGDAYMNGRVSVTRFYNRALSSVEVQQNFNALRGRYGI